MNETGCPRVVRERKKGEGKCVSASLGDAFRRPFLETISCLLEHQRRESRDGTTLGAESCGGKARKGMEDKSCEQLVVAPKPHPPKHEFRRPK